MLWFAGIVLWVVVMYTFFTAAVVRETKPTLETGINGAWLLGDRGDAIRLRPGSAARAQRWSGREAVLFFALCMYLLGAMLYLTIITLIFYRFTFVALTVEQMTPPYWINMGAVAITTLAGSSLLLHAGSLAFLVMLRPFLAGFTLFFWATATWWIPLLRHPRHVAARRPAFSPAVRPAVLGHGVSAGHVHGLHRETGPGHGPGIPLVDSARHRLLRPGGVGRHVWRHDASPVAGGTRDS